VVTDFKHSYLKTECLYAPFSSKGTEVSS